MANWTVIDPWQYPPNEKRTIFVLNITPTDRSKPVPITVVVPSPSLAFTDKTD